MTHDLTHDLARIHLNVTPATETALRLVMVREDVPMTEALRRLVGYGDLVYRAVQLDGADVLVQRGRRTERVILLDIETRAPETLTVVRRRWWRWGRR